MARCVISAGASLAVLLAWGGHLQAQTAQTAQSKEKPAVVSLTGCVSAKAGTAGYTFVQSETGSEYRLTGTSVRKFAGKRVELVGGSGGKGLTIRGGLFPSPNIAAQAGDLDPAQQSIARQPGGAASGQPAPQLPEFRVTRVRAVEGSCQ